MKPIRNPDVKTTLLPDGFVVLFSTKTEWAHTLNPIGAIVWEYCDGCHSVDEIVAEVRQILEEKEEVQLSQVVRTFVEELLNSGLLVESCQPV
jgi:hypothetical protein